MGDNVPLTKTENPTPPVGVDQRVTLAGNYRDDDAIALDQYFEAGDTEPERFDGLRIPQAELPSPNRLVIASQVFNASDGRTQAVQLLPADVKRKSVTLTGYQLGTNTVLGFLVGGNSFSYAAALTGPASIMPSHADAYFVMANLSFSGFTLDYYQGAVWVMPIDNTTAMMIQAVAVTE